MQQSPTATFFLDAALIVFHDTCPGVAYGSSDQLMGFNREGRLKAS